MSRGFTVPRTFAAAAKRLADIDGLVTATEWERAAIVAAFCSPGRQNGTKTLEPKSFCPACTEKRAHSFMEFAAHRVNGLKSDVTVSKYYRAWAEFSGFESPEPGMTIPLDELPSWESVRSDLPYAKSKQDDIKRNPAAVAATLADPVFAAKVARQMTPKARVETQSAVHAATRESMSTISDSDKAARRRDKAAFDKAARSMMWDNADGYIGMARTYLVKVVDYVRMDGWPDKDRDDLVAELDRVMSLCRMIRADLTGESGTNWDAELAAMLGGAK